MWIRWIRIRIRNTACGRFPVRLIGVPPRVGEGCGVCPDKHATGVLVVPAQPDQALEKLLLLLLLLPNLFTKTHP
jgi:hypothetical protein